MASLAYCLKKYGITGVEAKNLKDAAKAYLDEGYAPEKANVSAVEDMLRDLGEERTDILKQVEKAVGRAETPAEVEFPIKSPKSKLTIKPIWRMTKKESLKTNEATRLASNYEVPKDSFVHGREGKQELSSDVVILASKDWVVAEQYAGDKGSQWLIKPTAKTKIIDVTDTKQAKKIIDALESDYKDDKLSLELDDLMKRATKKDLFDELNPDDIVDSAGLFDMPSFTEWLAERFNYDMVITNNGAAILNKENVKTEKRVNHLQEVKQAVLDGKPVPRHVLEEYRGEPWADKALKPPVKKASAKVVKSAKVKPAQIISKKEKVEKPQYARKPKGPLAYSLQRKGEPALDAQKIFDHLKPILAKWTNAPRVKVVQTEKELPVKIYADARMREQEGGAAPGVQGVYHDGMVHIVADNISNMHEAERVLLHESLRHYGFRLFLGSKYEAEMNRAGLNKAVAARAKAKAKEYGLDWNKHNERINAIDEALAEMGDLGVKNSMWDRLVMLFKKWLGKINAAMSDAEVRQLIIDSSWAVRKGKRQATAFTTKGTEFIPLGTDAGAVMYARKTAEKLKEDIAKAEEILKSSKDLLPIVQNKVKRRALARDLKLPDSDMKLLDTAFGTPYGLGRAKSKAMKEHVQVHIDRVEERSEQRFNWLKPLGDFFSLKGEDFNLLREIIWAVEGKPFSEEKTGIPSRFLKRKEGEPLRLNLAHYKKMFSWLKEKGVPQNVARIFTQVRFQLDKVIVDADAKMRQENVEPGEIEYYRQQMGKIHNYFPHQREGNTYVKIVDPKTGDTIYREHFNTLQIGKKSFSFKDKREIKSHAVEWAKANGYEHIKPKDVEVGRVKQLSDEVFFNIPVEDMNQIVKAAMTRLEGTARTEDQKKVAKQLSRLLPRAIADVFKLRGWGAHTIRRQDVPGFETQDIKRVLYNYFNGYAGMVTKAKAAQRHSKILFSQDAKNKVEYEYTTRYVRDVLANADKLDKVVDNIRAFFFLKYIGGIIKTSAVNLTQNFVAAAPRLSIWHDPKTGNVSTIKNPTTKLAKAMSDVKRLLIDIKTKGLAESKVLNKDPKKNEEEKKALHEALAKGITTEKYLEELEGQLNVKNKTMNAVMKAAGLPMALAERFNRASTFLAAFRIARYEKGLSYDDAFKWGKQVVYDSHFMYGKGNLPQIFRGGRIEKVLRTAYTFRSFTANYLSLMKWLAKQGGPGYKAILRSLAGIIAMGGVTSIPLMELFRKLYKMIAGEDKDDPITAIRKASGNDVLRDVITFGLPGALGVDLHGSLSIEFPANWKEIIGVPYAIGTDIIHTYQDIKAGDYYRAIEDSPVTPMIIRNAMSGYRLHKKGQFTRTGRPIVLPGEKKARKISKGEMLAKSLLGFQPTSSSKAYMGYKTLQEEIDMIQEKKSNYATRYVNALRSKDFKEIRRIEKEIRAWNLKMRRAGKRHLQINLKRAVRARLKPKRAPRIFRRRELELGRVYQ